ncbi:hypothetical protein [Vibrio harveyi]|uniref:hypothetical protein n=1 Tax=Vibrio harveyi TaxID=669 RepID=UPI002480B9B1|nr:hypothetical protein [Vibrio harveyi]
MKAILILGCTSMGKRGNQTDVDLYQVKDKLLALHQTFEDVLALSGNGLVSTKSFASNCELPIPNADDEQAINTYCTKHKSSASKELKRFANEHYCLYIVLKDDHLRVFEQLFEGNNLLRKFKYHYISRNNKGVTELEARLTRIIRLENSRIPTKEPIWFRSGVSNTSELGYVGARCAVGGSLANTNTTKMTHLLNELLNTTHHRPLFLDNGLITLTNSGKQLDTRWVFDQYKSILKTLSRKQAKNLFVVIPDDIKSNQRALEIVRRHKREILEMSLSCEVILPIHKSFDIERHALLIMNELNNSNNIRLGIPSLTKPKLDLALSTEDIDRLLSIKNPRKPNKPLFNKIHFFGMSESSSKEKLGSRMLLAALHGIDGNNLSLDCCRTTALFGYNKTSLRKGSQIALEISQQHLQKQVVNSSEYQRHTFHEEFNNPVKEPFVTQYFYDMINEIEIFDFICLYNEVMEDSPSFKITHKFVVGEEQEAVELAWQMTSTRVVDQYIFERLKNMNWDKFLSQCESISEMSPNAIRFEAIRTLFSENRKIDPVQMPLKLTT